MAERLRTDPRVVVIDRTNLRYLRLQDLPGDAVPVDLVSLDLSFISVLKVMPVVCELLRPGGVLIVLVKPQFEAGRNQVRHACLSCTHMSCAAGSCTYAETKGMRTRVMQRGLWKHTACSAMQFDLPFSLHSGLS